MNENRERQMDRDIEDTSQERMEEEQIERVDERTAHRVDKEISENRAPADVVDDQLEPLFVDEAAKKFRSRWLVIQSKFVDDPRDSVKQADDLVADILKNVTMTFADRRISLEKQWNSGDNVSTEDMRQALKRYRAFFERLLTLES
jgi:hypothetical protein